MTALLLAEHDGKTVRPATLNTVTAAAKAAGAVHILVAGHNAADAANEAAKISGVSKVFLADGPQFANGLAEPIAAQMVSMATGYTHLFGAATAYGKNILPRVAAKLDAAQISDISSVESADTFTRPIYAGNAIATVQSNDPIKVVTARPTNFEPAASEGGSATVETVAAVAAGDSSRFVSRDVVKLDRPELQGAKIVISGGRGIGSAENFKLLDPLADKLNAAIGASRAAVDAGYAPNDWQVGQTGKVVAPQLYIAIGISGAIQHLAGMKDSKVIVAINKDPEAPIFQIADYGLVGDLFVILPELDKALSPGRS